MQLLHDPRQPAAHAPPVDTNIDLNGTHYWRDTICQITPLAGVLNGNIHEYREVIPIL